MSAGLVSAGLVAAAAHAAAAHAAAAVSRHAAAAVSRGGSRIPVLAPGAGGTPSGFSVTPIYS